MVMQFIYESIQIQYKGIYIYIIDIEVVHICSRVAVDVVLFAVPVSQGYLTLDKTRLINSNQLA